MAVEADCDFIILGVHDVDVRRMTHLRGPYRSVRDPIGAAIRYRPIIPL